MLIPTTPAPIAHQNPSVMEQAEAVLRNRHRRHREVQSLRAEEAHSPAAVVHIRLRLGSPQVGAARIRPAGPGRTHSDSPSALAVGRLEVVDDRMPPEDLVVVAADRLASREEGPGADFAVEEEGGLEVLRERQRIDLNCWQCTRLPDHWRSLTLICYLRHRTSTRYQ